MATDDIIPDELLDFSFGYIGESFCLDPFREVVCQARMKRFCREFGMGPIMSIPHRMKGYGAIIVRRSSVGQWIVGVLGSKTDTTKLTSKHP